MESVIDLLEASARYQPHPTTQRPSQLRCIRTLQSGAGGIVVPVLIKARGPRGPLVACCGGFFP